MNAWVSIAVQGGHDGGGVAGDVQQNGAVGAAEHTGVVEGTQQHDGGGGVHAVGQGQQQRHAGQGADAGHGPHQQPQQGA